MRKLLLFASLLLATLAVQADPIKTVTFTEETLTHTNVTAKLTAAGIGANEPWIAVLESTVKTLETAGNRGTFEASSYSNPRCANLLEVQGGDAVVSIGKYAFYKCTSLSSVSFPEATSVGNSAFYNCTALSSISFPAVTSIDESAFYKCTALSSVSFPAVTSIGGSAFSGCTVLSSVSFPKATNIGWVAFYKCIGLSSVSFPAVTSIREQAFSGCTGLGSVSFPAATSISVNAFYGCTNLSSVSFPEVENIDSKSFYGCVNLASVSFPKVIGISTKAFQNCTSLSTISLGTALSETDITFDDDVFLDVTTENIDLTLGENVDVSREDTDIANNKYKGYFFKSITQKTDTSIDNVQAEGKKVVGYYDLSGVKLRTEPESGIYIVTYDDGTSAKRMKK